MFGKNHYVPVVRWKRGEQKALELLDNSLKNSMTPLIEIPPIPWDFENEIPQKSVDEHLSEVAAQVKKSWNHEGPIFIDAYHVCIEDHELIENGQHPLEYLINELRAVEIKAIPVVRYSCGPNYMMAVKDMIETYKSGFCLRLKDGDLDDINNIITTTTDLFDENITNIDLIIDYGHVDPQKESRMTLLLSGSISLIPHLSSWRTFTICGTSFPENLSQIPTGSDGSIRRSEWHIYKVILGSKIKRYPSFGDYIISNPGYSEIDPRFMNMAASIRYTAKDAFLIFRGYSIRNPKYGGWGQMVDICKRVVTHPEYAGEKFSYGDEYIYNCSASQVGPGNPEIWRRVGTNHHLTMVIHELSKLPDVSVVH